MQTNAGEAEQIADRKSQVADRRRNGAGVDDHEQARPSEEQGKRGERRTEKAREVDRRTSKLDLSLEQEEARRARSVT